MTLNTIFSVVLAPYAFRATLNMSQGPLPCNDEHPWLSPKGCTMGVGKAIMCSHGPSQIVWSENGSCWGTISYFIGGKRGATLPTCYISPLSILSFIFLVLRWWGRKEKHNGSSWQKSGVALSLEISVCTWLCNLCLICKYWYSMKNERMP